MNEKVSIEEVYTDEYAEFLKVIEDELKKEQIKGE